MAKELQPNIFDLLSEARWAFADAASAVRAISDNLYSKNATTEDGFLRAEVALEKAAVIAEKLAALTTTLPDACVQPEDVVFVVREVKKTIRTDQSWLSVSKKADKIGDAKWRVVIEEWAREEGMGEVA